MSPQDARIAVDAPRRSRDTAPAGNDQKKPIQDKSDAGLASAGRWLSTGLCRCVSWNNLQQHDQAGSAAAGVQWRLAGYPCSRRAVVGLCAGLACLLGLLASSTALGVAVGWQLQLRQEAGLSSVAQYMHAIAAWHDASRQQQEAALPVVVVDAASFSWQACSQHVRLPEIQLPTQLPGPQWQPDAEGYSLADPLAQLALDCSSPHDAAACEAAAAASNAYEGEQLPLDSEDLQAHLRAVDEPQQLSQPDGSHDLSELELDCEADPEACEAIAAASNSYESSDDALQGDSSSSSSSSSNSFDAAAAEAAAFLTASAQQRDGSWDALLQQQLLLTAEQRAAALRATNSYEGEEQQWVGVRVAEEAGPHWLDVSRLELDCSQDSDPGTAAECERSRAVNRYEGPDTAGSSSQDAASHGAPSIGPAPLADAAPQHSHVLQQSRRRSSGYSVPAVEPAAVVRRLTAAAAAAAETAASADLHNGLAAGSVPPSQADERLRARRYFKTPCNSRSQHIAYKGEAGQHRQRLFYKNGANAPATLAAGSAEPSQAAGRASAGSQLLGLAVLRAAGMLAAFLASAAATLHLLCHKAARKQTNAGKPSTIASRRPCPSTVLVPGTTEELPAPQLARYSLQPVLQPAGCGHGCEIEPDNEQLCMAGGCDTLVTSQLGAAAAGAAFGHAASGGDGSAGLFVPAGGVAVVAAAAGVVHRGVLAVHMAELLGSSDAPPSQMVDSPRRSRAGTPVPRGLTPVPRAGTPVRAAPGTPVKDK